MKMLLGSALAGLICVGLITAVSTAWPSSKSHLNITATPSSRPVNAPSPYVDLSTVPGEELDVPVNAATPSTTVTHEPPTQSDIEAFKSVGLVLEPFNDKATLSERDIMHKTDLLMKQFDGKSRNIYLYMVSRRFGENDFAPLSQSQIAGDPHIVDGKFKDVPCYLVTINGVNIPASGGPPGSSVEIPPARQLQVVVDATNGNLLLIFAVHKVSNPMH